jgi:Holliday junction resolvase RusA-like endonuclease
MITAPPHPVEIAIPGTPVAYGVQATRRGMVYERKRSRLWKRGARETIKDALDGRVLPIFPVDVALRMEIVAVFPCPRSAHRVRIPAIRRWMPVMPDLSNIVKAAEDACNELVYADDRQIVVLAALQLYGSQDEDPQVTIRVDPLSSGSVHTVTGGTFR